MNMYRVAGDQIPLFHALVEHVICVVPYIRGGLTQSGCWASLDMLEVGVTVAIHVNLRDCNPTSINTALYREMKNAMFVGNGTS